MSVFSILFYILIGLLSFLFFKWRQRLQYWQNLGIPCEEPHLVFGNMTGVRTTRTFNDIWMSYYNKFKGTGPFAGFYLFNKPSVFVLEPFLVKQILIKNFSKFTDRGFYSNEKDDPLTGQLFLLDGHRWRNLRNKLSPVFTSGKIKNMFPIIIRIGQELVDVINEFIQKQPIVEVKELLARFTTDVIGTCAFGIDCSSLKDPEAEFRIMGRKSITDVRHGNLGAAILVSFPELARKLHIKQTPEHIESFFMKIVRETVDYREKNGIRRNDFMDQLIDMKNNKLLKTETGETANLTLEEIAAQAFVFFNAGFETSSTTMGFALYELAQHLDIQQQVRTEVNAVFAKHNNEFTYECIKDMIYLDQVISETLRLYTVLPVLNRLCLEDFVVPGYPNYVIKKGMSIIIPASAMHRDATLYPEPDVFNPDNFNEERVKKRDSVEWLPFGDGPRNCIGMRFGQMQSRIGLALLIKNFKFSFCEQTTFPLKYDKKSFLISAADGIYLKVERVNVQD